MTDMHLKNQLVTSAHYRAISMQHAKMRAELQGVDPDSERRSLQVARTR